MLQKDEDLKTILAACNRPYQLHKCRKPNNLLPPTETIEFNEAKENPYNRMKSQHTHYRRFFKTRNVSLLSARARDIDYQNLQKNKVQQNGNKCNKKNQKNTKKHAIKKENDERMNSIRKYNETTRQYNSLPQQQQNSLGQHNIYLYFLHRSTQQTMCILFLGIGKRRILQSCCCKTKRQRQLYFYLGKYWTTKNATSSKKIVECKKDK